MEPFLSCMKEPKGLPLQTSASGSGAAVVTPTVVVATVVASVVLGAVVVAEGA